jgi:AraC-like DNA-binding protein
VTHQLDGGWADLLLLYLEPEGAKVGPWATASRNDIQPLDQATAASMRAAVRKLVSSSPEEVDVAEFYDGLVPSVGLGGEGDPPLDARVAEAVQRLRDSRHVRRPLLELAREVGLSPGRFRHVFRREVGMSAQSYVVWLRIYEACAALASGASLSDAALEAGFSDAAHFTRTFRRTFGLAPSQVAGRLTLMKTRTG